MAQSITNNYNLRYNSYFAIPSDKSVYNGKEKLSSIGPKIWNLVQINWRN